MTSLQDFLQACRERLEKAHREICDLASGKRKWEMCIPPQPTDSDLTLQAPLDDLAKLLAIVEVLSEACAFYKDRNNWEHIEGHTKWASNLRVQDCALLNCGGGRARLAMEKCQAIAAGKEGE